jgi:hypothetical protein
MLRVDAKQGAPKNGSYPLELFQVGQFMVCGCHANIKFGTVNFQ